ncbi:YciI family protein [Segetibacter aerophilus]|nr:YciI family protein [Segetibacter aerophilus]
MPSRPDFSQTMTEEELSVMKQHAEYLKEYMNQGSILIFGPVLDPNGAFGLAIVAADNEDEVKRIIENDPASKINKYEYYPMLATLPQ